MLGNYWKSCHNIELDENNRLTATCRCCDKHEYETKFVESSLKVPCEEDSYVEVVKGELKCGKMGTQECGIFMKIFGDCKTKIFVEDEVDADNSEL